MKAPETIFLHGYSFDDKPCKDWTLEPLKRGLRGYAVQNEKYIRKDALLEWVKEQASITEKLNGKGAMLKAWNTLIDKIESL